MKYLGITEEFTTCDCCDKSNLKCTVAFETESHDILYYGRTCAARNTGKPLKDWQSEYKKELNEKKRAARKEIFNSKEHIEYHARLEEAHRNKIEIGVKFRAYCEEKCRAYTTKKEEILLKYGIKTYIIWP